MTNLFEHSMAICDWSLMKTLHRLVKNKIPGEYTWGEKTGFAAVLFSVNESEDGIVTSFLRVEPFWPTHLITGLIFIL